MASKSATRKNAKSATRKKATSKSATRKKTARKNAVSKTKAKAVSKKSRKSIIKKDVTTEKIKKAASKKKDAAAKIPKAKSARIKDQKQKSTTAASSSKNDSKRKDYFANSRANTPVNHALLNLSGAWYEAMIQGLKLSECRDFNGYQSILDTFHSGHLRLSFCPQQGADKFFAQALFSYQTESISVVHEVDGRITIPNTAITLPGGAGRWAIANGQVGRVLDSTDDIYIVKLVEAGKVVKLPEEDVTIAGLREAWDSHINAGSPKKLIFINFFGDSIKYESWPAFAYLKAEMPELKKLYPSSDFKNFFLEFLKRDVKNSSERVKLVDSANLSSETKGVMREFVKAACGARCNISDIVSNVVPFAPAIGVAMLSRAITGSVTSAEIEAAAQVVDAKPSFWKELLQVPIDGLTAISEYIRDRELICKDKLALGQKLRADFNARKDLPAKTPKEMKSIASNKKLFEDFVKLQKEKLKFFGKLVTSGDTKKNVASISSSSSTNAKKTTYADEKKAVGGAKKKESTKVVEYDAKAVSSINTKKDESAEVVENKIKAVSSINTKKKESTKVAVDDMKAVDSINTKKDESAEVEENKEKAVSSINTKKKESEEVVDDKEILDDDDKASTSAKNDASTNAKNDEIGDDDDDDHGKITIEITRGDGFGEDDAVHSDLSVQLHLYMHGFVGLAPTSWCGVAYENLIATNDFWADQIETGLLEAVIFHGVGIRGDYQSRAIVRPDDIATFLLGRGVAEKCFDIIDNC